MRGGGGGVVDGVAEVGVAGKVSMNFEFMESRKTRDEVVKFRGVGIADEEIFHYKGVKAVQ